MNIQLKRVYDEPSSNDGYRVLVDRLWPRGISKERAKLDGWCKDVAPSTALRTWFGHKPARFNEFRELYTLELDDNVAVKQLKKTIKNHRTVTLLYAARDPEINHAQVLLAYLTRQ